MGTTEFYWALAYIFVFVIIFTSKMEDGIKTFAALVIVLTLLWIQQPAWFVWVTHKVKMFFDAYKQVFDGKW
ncbi:MAG: hypothetical protein HQL25_04005 [Candidatus Omnitrophica bacterium]|nr:hypothetical protein [Candidatus Omnitrophota bacterium]